MQSIHAIRTLAHCTGRMLCTSGAFEAHAECNQLALGRLLPHNLGEDEAAAMEA
jgi:hypothetical protein